MDVAIGIAFELLPVPNQIVFDIDLQSRSRPRMIDARRVVHGDVEIILLFQHAADDCPEGSVTVTFLARAPAGQTKRVCNWSGVNFVPIFARSPVGDWQFLQPPLPLT